MLARRTATNHNHGRIALELLILGLLLRLWLNWSSLGTNDLIFWMMWASLAEKYGIANAYLHSPFLNHPPLSLVITDWIRQFSEITSFYFGDVFRAFQIAADSLTAALMVVLADYTTGSREKMRLAIFYYLCPAAIFVSAFHVNSDPTMVTLLVAAVILTQGRMANALLSGGVLGLAIGIKIIPLFCVPLFLLTVGRSKTRQFLLGLGLVLAAVFLPSVLQAGPTVLMNIFGHRGVAGGWGIPALFTELESLFARPRSTPLFWVAYYYAVWGKYVVLLALATLFGWLYMRVPSTSWTRQTLMHSIGAVMLMVIFLGPGFGVQYLAWPVAFLPFALSRRSSWMLWGTMSLYLAFTYTVWSGSLPWNFANAEAAMPGVPWVKRLGLLLWMHIGYCTVEAIRGLRDVASLRVGLDPSDRLQY